AEDGIRARNVTGVQTCALPISETPAAANSPAIDIDPSGSGAPATAAGHEKQPHRREDCGYYEPAGAERGAAGDGVACATRRRRRSEERRVGKGGGAWRRECASR